MTEQGQRKPRPRGGHQGRPAADRWQAVGREFGLYTIAELAVRMQFGSPENLRARNLTGDARVLAVPDGDRYLYPGFQFDEDAARMVPVVQDVVRQGRTSGWTDEELVLWFCRPNKALSGRRPVDALNDAQRLRGAAGEDFRQATGPAA